MVPCGEGRAWFNRRDLDVPKRLVFQLGTGLLKEEEGKPTFFFTIL